MSSIKALSLIHIWLNAAEYIMAEGNPNVVLCERGIRTYETATRNTLDISAVPVIRSKSHLPIIVDPSHATGVRAYVAPLAKCAIAAGADGIMVEAHNLSLIHILLITGKLIREVSASASHGAKCGGVPVKLHRRDICFNDLVSFMIRIHSKHTATAFVQITHNITGI